MTESKVCQTPEPERKPACPLCGSREYFLETDRDEEGNIENAWRECRDCDYMGPPLDSDRS